MQNALQLSKRECQHLYIKEAHKLSITTGEHVVILVYSPNGNPYFYDSSYNFNTIDTFLNQNLENIVVDPDDVKAYTVH